MRETKTTSNSQSVSFLIQDYEQTWEMIRHNDTIRMEWLKYYLSLLTATGTVLIALSTFRSQNVQTILINGNLFFLILIAVESAGLLTLAFHLSTRIRNIRLLLKLDTLRATIFILSKPAFSTSQWDINPKWVSFAGMDAFITYLLSSINSFLFAIALSLSGVAFHIVLSSTVGLFVVLLLIYFGTLLYSQRRAN